MTEDEPQQSSMDSETVQGAVSARELREILSSYEFFYDLSEPALEALAGAAERVFVQAGQRILEVGVPAGAAFIVEYGRLRIVARGSHQTITLEQGRGELIGMISLLSREPFDGDAFALRDSKLIRLSRGDLLRCMASHPELIEGYSKYVADIYLRTHGKRAARSRPQAFAVLPVGEDPDLRAAVDSLLQAFSEIGAPGSLVDSQRVQEALGPSPSDVDVFENGRQRVVAWCEEQETEGRFLLLVCDPKDTSWTRWCLEQTDRIVVVAKANATSEIARIDREFAGRKVAGSAVEIDLLLIQERDTELPRGTGRWMDLACRRRHHHVRPGNKADFRRAARHMSERAVGVVLGGGGARGFAHIGVLQALEEAGIPIDAIGGTSMGAVMAAAYARGWSPQRMLEMVREVFQNARSVMDLDFPMVALLGGRKLDLVLRSVFEEIDIADLWLPYYCISSSLTSARMVIHDRGPVWRSVRASCSLPGIFPPVRAEGQLLVDGGVMNNVPMDIMGNRCAGGTVIAIDVGGGGARNPELEDWGGASGWGLLSNRLNPISPNKQIANIFQILIGATTLSSNQYLQQLVATGHVDLFLTPPVQEFQLLGFDAYEKLYQIGYEYTRKQLAEWDGLEGCRS
jgi:NTE family protein/lysophospholipid hydrolase